MTRVKTQPLLENTRRRPEAFHAVCLKDQANELLRAIMALTHMRPNRPNELYLPVRRRRDQIEDA